MMAKFVQHTNNNAYTLYGLGTSTYHLLRNFPLFLLLMIQVHKYRCDENGLDGRLRMSSPGRLAAASLQSRS
jgi:hypothetical protein